MSCFGYNTTIQSGNDHDESAHGPVGAHDDQNEIDCKDGGDHEDYHDDGGDDDHKQDATL